MDNDKIMSEIRKQFEEKGLFRKLSAESGSLQLYLDELMNKLPEIYKELKTNEVLPEYITYEIFMGACNKGFEEAQIRQVFGNFNFFRSN